MLKKKKIVISFYFGLLIILMNSCINKNLIHGNLPEAELVSLLKIGKDDKNSISKILGHPTFEGTLGDNSFYYMGTVNSKLAFLKPKLQEQFILELKFDKSDLLKKIYIYNKEQAMDVAMSSLKTESAGRKASFFQDLLANIGVPGMKRGGPIIGSGKAND